MSTSTSTSLFTLISFPLDLSTLFSSFSMSSMCPFPTAICVDISSFLSLLSSFLLSSDTLFVRLFITFLLVDFYILLLLSHHISFKTLWRFSRPHTIIGTSVSILAIYRISLSLNPSPLDLFSSLLSSLLMNIYITGINQLSDTEIDKINKPNLPLVTKELSYQSGLIVVLSSGIFSVLIALLLTDQQFYLIQTVLSACFLGTLYSLYPFRLKRFPLLAAFCVVFVRGIVVQMGFYALFTKRISSDFTWETDGILAILTIFLIIFSIVIALFKDLPDSIGDKENHIVSFTVRWGEKRIFYFCILLLCVDYIIGIVAAWKIIWGWEGILLGSTHAICLGIIGIKCFNGGSDGNATWSTKKNITEFYMFIWKLFYLEYSIMMIIGGKSLHK